MVVDYKGYTPAICEQHRNLSRLFCKECEAVFCWNCTIKHSNHHFVSVSDQSIQVRKQIFDHLGMFETVMKLINHQKDVSERSLEVAEKLSRDFAPDKIVDSLSEVFQRAILNNADEWKKTVSAKGGYSRLEVSDSTKNFCVSKTNVAQKSERKIESLKISLQKSDGSCVQAFTDSRHEIEKALSDQKSSLKQHVYFEWVLDLETIVESSIQNFLCQIEVPDIKSVDFEKVKISSRELQCAEHELLDFHQISCDGCSPKIKDTSFAACELFSIAIAETSVKFSILHKLQNEKCDVTNLTSSTVQRRRFCSSTFR